MNRKDRRIAKNHESKVIEVILRTLIELDDATFETVFAKIKAERAKKKGCL